MNYEILILDKDNTLKDFRKARPVYKTFENDMGKYDEIVGQLNILSDINHKIEIPTKTLESDVYSLLYSINDFLEFDFASFMLNNDSNILKYESTDNGCIFIEMDNNSILLDKKAFLSSIINNSIDFYTELNNQYCTDANNINSQVTQNIYDKIINAGLYDINE